MYIWQWKRIKPIISLITTLIDTHTANYQETGGSARNLPSHCYIVIEFRFACNHGRLEKYGSFLQFCIFRGRFQIILMHTPYSAGIADYLSPDLVSHQIFKIRKHLENCGYYHVNTYYMFFVT